MTPPADPPPTERRPVTERLHGDEIVDPYRWLEDDTDEVVEWVHGQNEYTDEHLNPGVRERLRPRFESLARTTDYEPPVVAGDTYFQRVEGPDDDHPVVYVRDGPDGERRALIDPNEFAEGVSVDWFLPSPDGKLVLYGRAEGGAEQYDLRVVDLDGEVRAEIPDTGRSGRWTSAWYDGGFYYVATGGPGGDQLDKELRRYDFEDGDRLVTDDIAQTVWPVLEATEAGHLVAAFSEMSTRTDVYAMAPDEEELSPAILGVDATFSPTVVDETVYFDTTHDAPRGRVLAVPVERLVAADPGNDERKGEGGDEREDEGAGRDEREDDRGEGGKSGTGDREGETAGLDPGSLHVAVPERDAVLRSVHPAGGDLLAHYHRDACSVLSVYDPRTGERRRDLDLPAFATVSGIEGDADRPELFYRIESFDRPPSVYRADAGTGETELLDAPDVGVGVDLSVTRECYESADGTEIPAFVVYRSDLDLDGTAPAAVYGYGGFRNDVTPVFRRYALPFLRAGGVFVQAVLRGGAEYGEDWHEAGMRENKQNVFDDFYAVAEGVAGEYADPQRLGAVGRSNGGLLAAAAVTQRPDLWRAAVAGVPLTDMLRFHRFLLGESWTTEYGSPEDPEAYEWLRDYSPYHNVAEREYPATLLWTAESDTRVHPAHARKLAARLQANQTGAAPICLRTHSDAGHGVGMPTALEIEKDLDQWGFLIDRLGIDPEDLPEP